MNIKEAIDHCQEVIANTNNTSCQLDHRQLIDWLTELHNLKNPEKMYNIGFTLGDVKGLRDHITLEEHIQCNYSVSEITEAYRNACKKLDFDIIKFSHSNCCINIDTVKRLMHFGVIDPEYEEDGIYCLEDSFDFINTFFRIVKIELPDIEWSYRDFNEDWLEILHGAANAIL